MVGLGRFELPTSRLSGVRSNQLSYRPDQSTEKRLGSEAKPPGPNQKGRDMWTAQNRAGRLLKAKDKNRKTGPRSSDP